ncbi:MAG TPA: MBL fold metallo-hydrolase [Thermomicrobiales bacterium]|nr:MBL fold metallo-hydrolase [Thermomicrobiales bacterium]
MLIELGPRTLVAPGGVNVGVLRGDAGQIVLVDTGLNEANAKKALKAAREEAGGEVVAIVTTHAHADHFGGNAAVVKRTGAKVYAPAFDEAFLRYPLLQPIALYGGADPLDTLRGNFLLASPSPVDVVIEPGPLTVAGIELEIIPLFGHSPGQIGVLVDDIFYCADVVLPPAVLDKYRILYLFSVSDHLQALERAAAVSCRAAVPGHGPAVADLTELIDRNRTSIEQVAARVLAFARESVDAGQILADLLQHFGANPADAPGFYLLQPTAFAFVSHLHRHGRLRHELRDGRSLWVAV